jgi:soluble epoxide hydrolase/lipid-phosphate phosphatase
MSEFPRKTFTVGSSGNTYEYIRIEATSPTKSTIAFFHGFPAIAFGWRHQIKYFADKGHGIIAPDLLGYGGTSKPESASDYRMRILVEDIREVLDHEKIDNFHGVGHDAGSYFLSRLYNYHPARLLSLTLISVPYNLPGIPFDLEAVNQLTKNLIGFEKFGYIQFLASDRSPEVIAQHVSLCLSSSPSHDIPR